MPRPGTSAPRSFLHFDTAIASYPQSNPSITVQAIRSIVFIPNQSKPEADGIAVELETIARREGVETRIERTYPVPPDALKGVDLCCVIGGDGTLLSVVPAALESGTAVLGINLGKLGFLATVSAPSAATEFASMLKGGYKVVERAVFKATTAGGESAFALNDIVLKEARGYGLVRLQVRADGQRVSEYHSDGLIFSTPTGSTAYNLSAGGPIVGPDAQVFVMTPICPHTLGNRSVIFGTATEIVVENLDAENGPKLSLDGRPSFAGSKLYPLKVEIAERTLKLVQKPDYAPFRIVREKLKWGDPAIPSQHPDSDFRPEGR